MNTLQTQDVIIKNVNYQCENLLTELTSFISYNKSQQDALFLSFILVMNFTYFGQIYCPSSGVLILYSQHLVFVMPAMLTLC